VAAGYRQFVYQAGEARGLRMDGWPTRPGIAPSEAGWVLEEGGELPMWVLLRRRTRYFTDGLVDGRSIVIRLNRTYTALLSNFQTIWSRDIVFVEKDRKATN
jgi:hypothetical protein